MGGMAFRQRRGNDVAVERPTRVRSGIASFVFLVPKGLNTPGQRPGAANPPSPVAPKWHNRSFVFGSCPALSGLVRHFPHRTQGVALGWYVAAPLGRFAK